MLDLNKLGAEIRDLWDKGIPKAVIVKTLGCTDSQVRKVTGVKVGDRMGSFTKSRFRRNTGIRKLFLEEKEDPRGNR